MPALAYDALNETQAAQVAYLFCDELFNTDARAYLYEINREGDVTIRTMIEPIQPARANYKPTVKIVAQVDAYPSEDALDRAAAAMESLAASIAESIYQKQLEKLIHVTND